MPFFGMPFDTAMFRKAVLKRFGDISNLLRMGTFLIGLDNHVEYHVETF
jgi:hypothetical protein